MNGWICGLIGAAIGSWLGFGVAAVLNISGQQAREEVETMCDWRTRVVVDFARAKGVTIRVFEDWKAHRLSVSMSNGTHVVTGYIEWDEAAIILPFPFLNGLYQELMEAGDG